MRLCQGPSVPGCGHDRPNRQWAIAIRQRTSKRGGVPDAGGGARWTPPGGDTLVRAAFRTPPGECRLDGSASATHPGVRSQQTHSTMAIVIGDARRARRCSRRRGGTRWQFAVGRSDERLRQAEVHSLRAINTRSVPGIKTSDESRGGQRELTDALRDTQGGERRVVSLSAARAASATVRAPSCTLLRVEFRSSDTFLEFSQFSQ